MLHVIRKSLDKGFDIYSSNKLYLRGSLHLKRIRVDILHKDCLGNLVYKNTILLHFVAYRLH